MASLLSITPLWCGRAQGVIDAFYESNCQPDSAKFSLVQLMEAVDGVEERVPREKLATVAAAAICAEEDTVESQEEHLMEAIPYRVRLGAGLSRVRACPGCRHCVVVGFALCGVILIFQFIPPLPPRTSAPRSGTASPSCPRVARCITTRQSLMSVAHDLGRLNSTQKVAFRLGRCCRPFHAHQPNPVNPSPPPLAPPAIPAAGTVSTKRQGRWQWFAEERRRGP